MLPNTGFSGPGIALVDAACLLEDVTAHEEDFQFDLPAEPSPGAANTMSEDV